MKRNVLVFGSISGIAVSIFMFCSMLFVSRNGLDGSMLVGYASMLVAFSFIFVAVKNYRDKYNEGVVTFGKAFQIGLYIALIGSTFYVITWAFEYHFLMPDFLEKYSQHMIDGLTKSGATQATIDAQVAEMGKYREMYHNPVFFALMTYMEILPIGIIVALAAALILKKKSTNLSATTQA
jgi:hypothetical protein